MHACPSHDCWIDAATGSAAVHAAQRGRREAIPNLPGRGGVLRRHVLRRLGRWLPHNEARFTDVTDNVCDCADCQSTAVVLW